MLVYQRVPVAVRFVWLRLEVRDICVLMCFAASNGACC
jgi:hypothetical protein